MAGKKPSRGTSKDQRLKANAPKATAPKFGSPAWNAKYGIKQFKGKGKK